MTTGHDADTVANLWFMEVTSIREYHGRGCLDGLHWLEKYDQSWFPRYGGDKIACART
jgi:hypothetical protein